MVAVSHVLKRVPKLLGTVCNVRWRIGDKRRGGGKSAKTPQVTSVEQGNGELPPCKREGRGDCALVSGLTWNKLG